MNIEVKILRNVHGTRAMAGFTAELFVLGAWILQENPAHRGFREGFTLADVARDALRGTHIRRRRRIHCVLRLCFLFFFLRVLGDSAVQMLLQQTAIRDESVSAR